MPSVARPPLADYNHCMSASGLFASLIVGAVGWGFFRYGRRQARLPQILVGLSLMIYPYFVANVASLVLVGGALLGSLWLMLRMGM